MNFIEGMLSCIGTILFWKFWEGFENHKKKKEDGGE